MTLYLFYGRVLPERAPLTLDLPEVEIVSPDFRLKFRCHIVIREAKLTAAVFVDEGATDMLTLRNLVRGVIGKYVNLIGYLVGRAFDVDMSSVIIPDRSEWRPLDDVIPVLQDTNASRQIDGRLLAAISADIGAEIALTDYRAAMTAPVATGFHCYRAIEAMMHSMQPDESEEDERGWERLRDHLRVSKPTIMSIRRHALSPRHGKIWSVTDDQRAQIFKITRDVIKRYFEYLMRGREQLPEAGFEVLSAEVT
jgi:hypothetical protein